MVAVEDARPPKRPAIRVPSCVPALADRDVADEGDACDQHHRPPERIRVERPSGAVALVGQERQHHHRDDRELDGGGQLEPLQLADPLVQCRLGREERGGGHGGGRRRRHLAEHRGGAEGKDQQFGDLGGDSEILVGARTDPVGDRNQGGEAKEGEAEDRRPEEPGEPAADAAEKPHQRKGADTGDPVAAGLLAGVPAALDAEEKANGERQAQTLEDLGFVHRLVSIRPVNAGPSDAQGVVDGRDDEDG